MTESKNLKVDIMAKKKKTKRKTKSIKMPKQPSPTTKLGAKVLFAAFQILKENDGNLLGREVVNEIKNRISFTDWDKEVYEKTGYIRWESILHFFTIDCVKAGYLVKKKGVWYLTPEGEKAMKLGDMGLIQAARKEYQKWVNENKASLEDETGDITSETSDHAIEAQLDKIEEQAIESIKSYIQKLNAYEFQDLVAALLRGMGYYTPFVAPKGKDGGIDIVAYKDPLGSEMPRMKVQIKHHQSPISVKDIRELMGLLQKDGDIGVFISSGGFTSDAKTTARSAAVHIELVELTRLIGLWQEFYHKMTDEDKALLPLIPIYFLAPND